MAAHAGATGGGPGAQMIHVPPELPDILKQFTKAAIKTQPPDVLAWSAAYFRALAKGEQPPLRDSSAGANQSTRLCPGLLRVLNKQLGPKILCPVDSIRTKWLNLTLSPEQFDKIVEIGKFEGNIHWLQFFALGCSSLSANLVETMKLVCELLSPEDDGSIPIEMFYEIYLYLALVDGTISKEVQEEVGKYVHSFACKQRGYFGVKNFYNNSAAPPFQ